jgi:ketol-acid reductoisomerase
VVISDTAEYGNYLFANAAIPLLADFMKTIDVDVIGKGIEQKDNGVDNLDLIRVNEAIRYTSIEAIGEELRSYMSAMKPIM